MIASHLHHYLQALITGQFGKKTKKMSGKSVYNLLQDNVSKPRFCKSLSTGETWSSKSMVALFSIEVSLAFKHYPLLCCFALLSMLLLEE